METSCALRYMRARIRSPGKAKGTATTHGGCGEGRTDNDSPCASGQKTYEKIGYQNIPVDDISDTTSSTSVPNGSGASHSFSSSINLPLFFSKDITSR